MTNLPEPTLPGEEPDRRLSSRDFELVIRRAAELQAREADEGSEDGIEQVEAIRIGRELGLSTRHLHQAIAEVGGKAEPDSGMLQRFYGAGAVQAGRAVFGNADAVAAKMERYFCEREYLHVLRRTGERIVFTQASGAAAAVGRATTQVFSRAPLLPVKNLTMLVHDLEEGYSHVTLLADLSRERTAAAAGSIVLGSGSTGIAALVLGIAIAPPVALLALPVLPASMWIGHKIHDNTVDKLQVHLESLLDRLEHGDLDRAARPSSKRWR